jgi:E3 ubiquitin-protein ligase DOA10
MALSKVGMGYLGKKGNITSLAMNAINQMRTSKWKDMFERRLIVKFFVAFFQHAAIVVVSIQFICIYLTMSQFFRCSFLNFSSYAVYSMLYPMNSTVLRDTVLVPNLVFVRLKLKSTSRM